MLYVGGMDKVSAQKELVDPEWEELAQKWEMANFHHARFHTGSAFDEAIGKVAHIYNLHEEEWPQWLRCRGIKPNANKPFRGLVGKLIGKAGASWATKCTGVLDEWREQIRDKRPDRDAMLMGLVHCLATTSGVSTPERICIGGRSKI